jgi:hypothetical protein
VNDACGFAAEDDVAGTRRLVERWLATPTPERREMAANARLCFANHFEINRAVDSMLRALETNS